MVRESRKEDLKEILELYLHLHEESIPKQSDLLLEHHYNDFEEPQGEGEIILLQAVSEDDTVKN